MFYKDKYDSSIRETINEMNYNIVQAIVIENNCSALLFKNEI